MLQICASDLVRGDDGANSLACAVQGGKPKTERLPTATTRPEATPEPQLYSGSMPVKVAGGPPVYGHLRDSRP